MDEEGECENIGGDVLKSSTLADLPRLSMCNPKSKHLSPGKRKLNIPARSPGTSEVGTRKTRDDPAEETHRIQQAATKQVWFRFEGKTRLIDIWGRDLEIEEEVREKMKIEKDLDIYMTSEGKMISWKDLEEIRDGRMVEVGLRMRSGGKKKGTKIGNQWERLVSGGETTGSEETENSVEDETKNDAMLHDVMNKAKMEGGLMHEMVETLAVLGQREREEMLRWYEYKMPKDISRVKHEVGILGIRWIVERKIEEHQGMLKEEVMKDWVKKGVFREGNSPNEIIDFGKHAGKTFREVYQIDQEYCSWTMKQERPGTKKLVQFKYFLRRMQDLTKRNMGICGKADEIERQLRDRILQLSCEEQMGKLVRQSTERMQKQEEDCKAEEKQKGKGRQRVDWADIDTDEPVNDMTYMNLGGSVQIEYPQEEQREEQRRHGGDHHVGSVSDRRHEKLQSEKDGVIQILKGNEGYRKIINMISETGDEEYGMQCFKAELHEKSGLDDDQINVLECGIRWAVEARRKERGEQQEQRRQGGQREQLAETRGGGWVWQGEEETGGDEDEHRERQGNGRHGQGEGTIESGNDMSKEDWGHSLEQKRASNRRERRERERGNWNSGGQIRLSGFGQDHWEGEMGSWYQDQWWIRGPGEKSQRQKDWGAWRNVGEDQERSFIMMEGARSRAKEDTVTVNMKIAGGGLGEEKEEDRRRRR